MSDVTPIRPDLPREPAPPTQKPASNCYDRLLVQIATLECVLATLSEWDLSGQPTDRSRKIGSAELVLRESIKALHDINADVSSLEEPNHG